MTLINSLMKMDMVETKGFLITSNNGETMDYLTGLNQKQKPT